MLKPTNVDEVISEKILYIHCKSLRKRGLGEFTMTQSVEPLERARTLPFTFYR